MSGRVLITGATCSGIGRQLALDFPACWLAGVGLRPRWRTAAELGLVRGRAAGRCRDVAAMNQMLRYAAAAGSADPQRRQLRVHGCGEGFDSELFARVIETNLTATGHALASCRCWGGITACHGRRSVSSLPLPRAEAYGASKAALDYLADTLRLDFASKGIGVTLIRPALSRRRSPPKMISMPCLVTVERASRAMMNRLAAGRHEYHFPRRFIWLLRLLGALPVGCGCSPWPRTRIEKKPHERKRSPSSVQGSRGSPPVSCSPQTP